MSLLESVWGNKQLRRSRDRIHCGLVVVREDVLEWWSLSKAWVVSQNLGGWRGEVRLFWVA